MYMYDNNVHTKYYIYIMEWVTGKWMLDNGFFKKPVTK